MKKEHYFYNGANFLSVDITDGVLYHVGFKHHKPIKTIDSVGVWIVKYK